MSAITDYLGAKLKVEWAADELGLADATAITTWASTAAGESVSLSGNGTFYTSPDGDGYNGVRVTQYQFLSCVPTSSCTHWIFVFRSPLASASSLFNRNNAGATWSLAQNSTTISFNHSSALAIRSITAVNNVRHVVCGTTDYNDNCCGIFGLGKTYIQTPGATLTDVRIGTLYIGAAAGPSQYTDVLVNHVMGCDGLTLIEQAQALALLRERWGVSGPASIVSGGGGVRQVNIRGGADQ